MASENTQSKVRHIPIFVEGRDEPVINKGSDNQSANNTQNSSATSYASAEANSNSQPYQQQQNHQRPPMGTPLGFSTEMPQHHHMGFNNDMTMPSSIFERAKDFPVREFFTRSASPRRSESPSQRPMPGFHSQQQQHPNNQARHSPSPSQQPPPQRTPQQQPNQFQTEHNQGQRGTTPQRQQQPEQESQQQKPAEPTAPKPNPIELSITKIQTIQKAVIDLMEQVEKFDGKSRKEYLYLDEMLTQNLLKLDTIDGNGNEIIKQSRRAAIKSVNALINNLEAKYEAAKESNDANNNGKSEANDVKSSGSGSSVGSHKNNSSNGLNTASKNSSYDNIHQTKSNNSVNMGDVNKELIGIATNSNSQQAMEPTQ
ncbi:unnamed protein product [Diamesa tonsa]